MFDVNALLGATLTQANKRRPAIAAGTVLVGTLGEPKLSQFPGKQDTTKTYTKLEIPVKFDLSQNPPVQTALGGIPEVTLTWQSFIDLTDTGLFDMTVGKNNGLRYLREAVGMNQEGTAFNLLAVQGRQIQAVIKNRPSEDGLEIYDEIKSIAKVG